MSVFDDMSNSAVLWVTYLFPFAWKHLKKVLDGTSDEFIALPFSLFFKRSKNFHINQF